MRWWGLTLAAVWLFLGGSARADEPPRVPIRDLPPLPEAESDEEVDRLTMTSAAQAEREVVVGASKREQSLGSVASAVTVITADRLRRWGYRTVSEALRSVVGLYVVDDRAIERLGIRGVQLLGDANTRILVLIDGSPVNEPWSQSVDIGGALPIHIDDVARIEVIRGPVSSIYGTNAFLGIINIVSIEADSAAPAHGRVTVGSFGSASGNAGFAVGDVHRQARGFVAFGLSSGETLRYEPYPEPGAQPPPELDDPTTADASDSLKGGAVVHYDRLFFQLRGSRRTRELPGAPFDAQFGSDDNQTVDAYLLGEVGYTRDLPREISLSGRLFTNYYRHQIDLSYAPNPSFRSIGSAFWWGGELRGIIDLSRHVARLDERARLDATAGFDTAFTQTEAESFDPGIPGGDPTVSRVERDFDIQGLYGEVNGSYPLPRGLELALTVGVRYDRNSQLENELSPRTALFVTRENRYGVKLLYARGFRNPSIFEAFFEDDTRYRPTCSPVCDTFGTTLLPERIASYEAVLWGRPLPGLKLRASVFRWQLERLIEEIRVFDPEQLEAVIQFGNIFVDFDTTGVEFEASYRDTRGWLGFASATAARVRRAGEKPANAPAITAKVGVSTPRLGGIVHISTEASYLGARDVREVDIDEEVRADAHLAWNAVVYLPDWRGIDVTVGVRNILGIRPQIPAQADYDRREQPTAGILLVPGAGREIFARMGYAF